MKDYIEERAIEIANYIIENKIKDHYDWRYMVVQDINSYLYLQYEILDTKEEFQYNPNKGTMYLTYEDYLNLNLPQIESANKRNQENWYYLENNIKPLNTIRKMPYTTRLSMNNVYFMGIVSLIILILFVFVFTRSKNEVVVNSDIDFTLKIYWDNNSKTIEFKA